MLCRLYSLLGLLLILAVNGGFQLQAQRYAGDYSETPIKNYVLPDAFFSLDAGVSYQYGRAGVALLVNNLTDHYNYTGNRTKRGYSWDVSTPRSFRLTVDYRFKF